MRKETRDQIEALRKPMVILTTTKAESKSWLGGLPMARSSFTWPTDEGAPLSFIGQIALEEVPRNSAPLELPEKGYLLFFGEPWAVGKVHYEPEGSVLGEIQAPVTAPPKRSVLRRLLGLPPKKQWGPVYERVNAVFEAGFNYPTSDRKELEALDIDDEDADEVADLWETVFKGQPAHHMFGYPEAIQNDDMELECEAEATGLDLRYENGKLPPHLEHLTRDSARWRLLFQIDSDDDIGFMWGDAGRIYFWMTEEDARQAAFDRVCVSAQCG